MEVEGRAGGAVAVLEDDSLRIGAFHRKQVAVVAGQIVAALHHYGALRKAVGDIEAIELNFHAP